MKKLLALVLALVMTLSLAVVGSNAAFKDADKVSATYAEAVDVLAGMKVFQGYTDGSFQPEGSITRAEVAAIVYRLYTGDVTDKQASLYATYNKFNDMDGASWAKGYIGYCGNAGLVKGYDAKTFGPSDKVTGYQALAMILRAVGYDKNNEFTGADWQLHVAQYAQQLGILKNVKGEDLNAAASRQLVAELLFQTAAKVPCVNYTAALGYTDTSSILGPTKNDTLGFKNFGLTKTADTTDKWGRPCYKWTNGKTGSALVTYATVKATPVATYQKAVAECDVAHDAGLKVDTAYTLYVNGQKQPVKYTVNLTDTVTKMGAQGRLFEVYDDTIVMIDTFLAKVTYVAPAAYDAQGHLRTDATIKLDVYDGTNGASHKLTLTNGEDAYPYAVDDYVLVNAWTNSTNSSTESGLVLNSGKEGTDYYGEVVAKATSVDGAQSVIYWNAKQHNVDGTAYDDAYKFLLDNAKQNTNKYTWFFDQYNNLIGNVELTSTSTYGVINSIWWAGNAADGSGVAKANVTYMDGTTGVIDISEMTYDNGSVAANKADETAVAPGGAAYAGYSVKHGNVAHSTSISGMMQIPDGRSFFYVDSFIDTNTKEDPHDILNGHLFQFNTKDNGTVSAVEVSGKGVPVTVGTVTYDFTKFHADNLAVNKLLQFAGGNLIVNANTTFLVRSGEGTTAKPYTFKSIVGYANIDKYVSGEVDYVDLNGDSVADYVYIISDTAASKVTSTFFYDGAQKAYTISSTTWAIPGYVDGVEKTIYADTFASDFVSKLTADTLYAVALKNDSVVKYEKLATLGTVTAATELKALKVTEDGADVTYELAKVYDDYKTALKYTSIVGADGDDFNGTVYKDGSVWYSVNAEEKGITKMPLALNNVADQNVIVVFNNYNADTNRNLALQVFAKDKVNTPANPTVGKAEADTSATWTYTFNGVTVGAPTCFKATSSGTAQDALDAAIANAKELSLKSISPAASGLTYEINVSGVTSSAIAVFATAKDATTLTTAAPTAVKATLSVGNYIVVAGADVAGAATHYEVFVVVE